MPAPFQISPATLAETADILRLEQLCYPDPWEERVIRPFIVAAGLPNKGYLARLLKEGNNVIAYALASRQKVSCWLSVWASTQIIAERKLAQG